MRLITDWHIHSQYSRACSKNLTLPNIAAWCERKGIDVAATGDWTHPRWFEHLQENLEEREEGMYGLRGGKTRFMLVTEVSQIYKRDERTRRVHNLIFAPSLSAVARVNAAFDQHGFNRSSDGRPILGIGSEELYCLLKEVDERIIVVPAHAWTPWYSVFGSKSGFDALAECFGAMTRYVYAIETGLSSDPAMNWRLSALDNVVMISNSDAHSCAKLGREANVFDLAQPSYDEFVRVLREQDHARFLYTIEFFPAEGKYHFDGCADCRFSCAPRDCRRLGERCPTCKKKLTLGVAHRVEDLADRDSVAVASRKIPFRSIVPLVEIIAEVLGVTSVASPRVVGEYKRLTDRVANEFSLLLDVPIEEIARQASHSLISEAVRRVRAGLVAPTPGYDGIYGRIRIFSPEETAQAQQIAML